MADDSPFVYDTCPRCGVMRLCQAHGEPVKGKPGVFVAEQSTSIFTKREAPTSSAPAGEPPQRPSFACPECGPRVPVDEDGCCRMCGADTTVNLTPENVAELKADYERWLHDRQAPQRRIADLEAFQTAVTVAIGAGHGGAAYEDVPQRIRALYAERDEALLELDAEKDRVCELRKERDAAHAHACENSLEERNLRAQVETLTAERDTLLAAKTSRRDIIVRAEQAEAQLTTLRTALETLPRQNARTADGFAMQFVWWDAVQDLLHQESEP